MSAPNTELAHGSPLLAACTEVLSEFLDDQLAALIDAARQPLLAAARDAGDQVEQDRLLSQLEEVETLGPQAAAAFRGAVLGRLQPGKTSPAPGLAKPAASGLALVETAKVDDWVRLRRLLVRHREGARAMELQLWKRLARVAGVAAEHGDCPVSLEGMCVLFQGAMHDLGASREARGAIYDAYESTVAARLSALMARLFTVLDEGETGAPAPRARPLVTAERNAKGPAKSAADRAVAEPAAESAARSAATGAPYGAATVGAAAGTGDGAAVSGDSVDPTRLLGAMAHMRRSSDVARDGEGQGADSLEAQLAAAVTPPGVTLDARERNTVAAIATLLQQVLEHPDLDSGVKRRLSRLAPGVLMLALQDDEYLAAELATARHDPVTGLFDRVAFRDRLEASMRAAVGGGVGPSVCLVDVDGYSAITARLGHQVGGRLLRSLGDLLRKHAGTSGCVARLRGDEFAVMLPSTREGAGRRYAERYLAALANARLPLRGEALAPGVSIGVVESDPALTTPSAMMQAADAARQAAKRAGGRRLHVHAPGTG